MHAYAFQNWRQNIKELNRKIEKTGGKLYIQ